jgi:hypothetical protein
MSYLCDRLDVSRDQQGCSDKLKVKGQIKMDDTFGTSSRPFDLKQDITISFTPRKDIRYEEHKSVNFCWSLTNPQLVGKGRKDYNPSKQRAGNIVKGWNPR